MVKQYKDEYKDDLVEIYNSNFPEYLRIKNRNLVKHMRTKYHTHFLVKSSGEIIGFALLNYFPSKNLVHLDYLALSKNVQGQGYGPKFMKYLLNEYQNNNFILECENHLIKFYEKNNFRRIKLSYKAGLYPLNLFYYGERKISLIKQFEIRNFMEGQYLVKSEFKFILMIPKILSILFRIKISKQLKYHVIDSIK